MFSLEQLQLEHCDLYEQSNEVRPSDELPTDKHLVGVVSHSHEIGQPITDTNQLIWFRVKPTQRISRLRKAYKEREINHEHVDPDLLFYGQIVAGDCPVEDLDRHGNRIIILRAADPVSDIAKSAQQNPILNAGTPISREPLKEVSREVVNASTPALQTPQLDPKAVSPQTLTPFGVLIPQPTPYPYTSSENISHSDLQSSVHHNLAPVPQAYPPIYQAAPPQQQTGFHYAPAYGLSLNIPPASIPQVNLKSEAVPQYNSNNESNPQSGLQQQGFPHPDEALPAEEEEPLLEDNRDYFEEADPAESHDMDNLFQAKNLQQLMKETSADLLEKGVEKGLNVLDSIKSSLQGYDGQIQDRDRYISTIDAIKQMATRSRMVVGVVGNTGAGKSSVINAVLEEERLLPTNCMRACTAVVTEVSWNEENNERKKYRAEVEFISAEDWKKELKILFDDMLTADGEVTRDSRNADTEAGISWAKLKAVYPQITKDSIGKIDPETLLNDFHVKRVLGQCHNVWDSSPSAFCHQLQQYVDSPEKKTDEQVRKREKKQMELWPLIKVVRIYVKSDAVSTGAVIVDLPGVHDSNAARAAVASSYLRQCTRLWIVAPINRAVDDKAAKKLLGDQFKRQLKYDGTYESVSFICSKTDDINITEASESVGSTEQINEWWDEIDRLEREEKELRKKENALKEERAVRSEIYDDQDTLVQKYEDLLEEAEEGREVFAPKEKATKRKRITKSKQSNKRMNLDSQASFIVSDIESDLGNEVSEDEDDDEDRGEPLTMEAIKSKLNECRELKTNARKEKAAIGRQIEELRSELKEITNKIDELESKIASECIKGRNLYSKGAIQQDFAAGIKELDQENAIEEDEENFNPDEDLRDYDAVARSLPVYCVSSKAYQKICGRMKKDAMPGGFKTKDETEIPKLQAHCKQLTEASRIAKCHGFFNKLHQLFNSLIVWSSQDGTGLKLTDAQHQAESNWLNKKLRTLEAHFDTAVTEGVEDIKDTLSQNLFQYYPAAIAEADAQAVPQAASWGKPKVEGGLFWATYKAITRRYGGPFTGSTGSYDFNKQLAEPIEKLLASRWELTFQRRFPTALTNITKKLNKMLSQFHAAVERRAKERGMSVPGLHLLSQHVQSSQNVFHTLVDALLRIVSEKQKEANRELVPVIALAMTNGYQRCIDECGPGSFKRMKEHMRLHVENERSTMFQAAVDGVKSHLRKMRLEVEEQMKNETENVFQTMRSEYFAVIIGERLPAGYSMPREERKLRRTIGIFVEQADERFRRVLDGEEDAEEERVEAEQSPDQAIGEITAEASRDVKLEDGDGVNGEASNVEVPVKDEASSNGDLPMNEPAINATGEDTVICEAPVDDSATLTSNAERQSAATGSLTSPFPRHSSP